VTLFSEIPYTLTVLVELVLLFLLLRGPFRKYPLFLVYILGQCMVSAVVEIAYYRVGFKSATYRTLYWTGEVTEDMLLFLLVIACIYEALRGSALRPKAAKVLGVVVLVTLALPFTMLHHMNHHSRQYGFFTSQWFNLASQIWNFGAAIMNLVLWMALLSNRRRDPQLVTLSIGVGLATASAAVAWGARQWLAEAHRWPMDIFRTVALLASILLWCWAFRPKQAGQSSSAAPPPGSAQPPSSAPPPDALTTPS
jgi:hypothetical protein